MIKKQQGLTAISWMIIIALVAIQGVMALRIIPVYMDFGTVKSVMNGIAEDPDFRGKTPNYIRSTLLKRLQLNSIYDLAEQPNAFKFQQQTDGMLLTMYYESRG
ncbi:MAG TPA: DUF4845 domain-containing protein, partial [Gammaproteobacteria bacterium]